MATKTSLPTRFQAHGTPGEGLLKITDTETGNSGEIPLSALPVVTNLLEGLFSATVTQETEAPSDVKAEEVKDSEEKEVPAPKRKPGRPKKVASEPASEETTEAPKRKPGRPKKVQSEEEVKTAEEAAPKRKPGRPKKTEAKPEEVKADAEVKPKRKPGRPKKEKTESAEAEPTPAKKPSKETAPAAGSEDEIVNEGFKVVRDRELDGVVYDIILDDGKAVGIIEMNDDGKTCTVRPGPQSSQKETTHVSLNGALARIYVDWVIDL